MSAHSTLLAGSCSACYRHLGCGARRHPHPAGSAANSQGGKRRAVSYRCRSHIHAMSSMMLINSIHNEQLHWVNMLERSSSPLQQQQHARAELLSASVAATCSSGAHLRLSGSNMLERSYSPLQWSALQCMLRLTQAPSRRTLWHRYPRAAPDRQLMMASGRAGCMSATRRRR
jgi:hypothetical protein